MELPKRAETYIAKCQYCDWISSQARAETRYFAKKHVADLGRALLAHLHDAHPDKVREIEALAQAKPAPVIHSHTRKRSVRKLREDVEKYMIALNRIINDRHLRGLEDARAIARDVLGKKPRYSWRRVRPPIVAVEHHK